MDPQDRDQRTGGAGPDDAFKTKQTPDDVDDVEGHKVARGGSGPDESFKTKLQPDDDEDKGGPSLVR